MSKAVQAASELGAVAVGVGAAMYDPELILSSAYTKIFETLFLVGLATGAGAIAQALGSSSGLGVTTRTPAGLRQIIRGIQRVGGTIVYCSTTGSTKRQYNMVIVLATHECQAIEALYLDGRQVYWTAGSHMNQTVGGYNFGGNADGSGHTGPDGSTYNFGGLVFCAAYYGDQTASTGFSSDLNANDSNWAVTNYNETATATAGDNGDAVDSLGISSPGNGYTSAPGVQILAVDGAGSGATAHSEISDGEVVNLVLDSGGNGYTNGATVSIDAPPTDNLTPYLGGCTWVYLKLEYDSSTFPQFPEIRFTVHGKKDIYDPRTGTKAWTANWALNAADVISDPTWGLGDSSINQDQLIAAANVCDETVECYAGTEARYSLHMHYDTSLAPGDVLARMMPAAAGRLTRSGGEWFIWPAYWVGPTCSFDQSALVSALQWSPYRKASALINRVTGTYIAPNWPYNVEGNLYDDTSSTQNNFQYAFQPTNFPMYACDENHGYGEDVYLIADTANSGTYNSADAYTSGAVVIYGGVPWQANEAVPAGCAPGSTDSSDNAYWSEAGNYLPYELQLDCVLSVSQAQRLAKIYMMRNRQQGSGTLTMNLSALQLQALDVFMFTFPALSWSDKYLEISSEEDWCMQLALGHGSSQSSDESAPTLDVQLRVCETSASVYEWEEEEELNVYDSPVLTASGNTVVSAPENVAAVSDLDTALVAADGIVTPRILVSWTQATDTYVLNGGQVQVQICATGTAAWMDSAILSGASYQVYLTQVVSGNAYDLRVRFIRSNGSVSAWVEVSDSSCGFALSSSDMNAVAASGTVTAVTLSATSSTIYVESPFTATWGSYSASCTPSPTSFTGLIPNETYYVYYRDASFSGGNITPIVTKNTGDFYNKVGYFLIGSIITPAYVGLRPSAYTTYSANAAIDDIYTPQYAYDNNTSTCAQISSLGHENSGGAANNFYYAGITYSGFPSASSVSSQQLCVSIATQGYSTDNDLISDSPWAVTACIGGAAKPQGELGTINNRSAWAASTAYAQWDLFNNDGIAYLVINAYTSGSSFGSADVAATCVMLAWGTNPSLAQATYSVALPVGTAIGSITVDCCVNPPTAASFGVSGDDVGTFLQIYEIYVE
ncbi:hypothetical protein ACOBR2_06735 [Telmatobacter bradus]|uniref:hypothetical protein n=1 Tax=Telmatobacter bradus TaxID=474953 RepID=UPI003B431F62